MKTPNPKENSVERGMKQSDMEKIDSALMGSLDKKSRLIVLEELDNLGLIFKQDAVEYVEICKICKGEGGIYSKHPNILFVKLIICDTCQGRGIVLKG